MVKRRDLPADFRLSLAVPAQGPVVAEMDLCKGVGEMLCQPIHRRLLDDVLPRGDNNKIARLSQALQTVVGSYTIHHACLS